MSDWKSVALFQIFRKLLISLGSVANLQQLGSKARAITYPRTQEIIASDKQVNVDESNWHKVARAS